MFFDYKCGKCGKITELEKSIKAPHPKRCPCCKSESLERHFGKDDVPPIIYAGRPGWTYNDVKLYKNMKLPDGKLYKIDKSKHGDLGSWHTSAEPDNTPQKKKKR